MKKIVAWALCVCWMGFIYIMSALPGDVSGAQSGTLTEALLRLIALFAGEEAAASVPLDALHLLIRKAAHITEYAVLCLLFGRALRLSGARRPLTTAFVLSTLYAATDEFHQSFVGGRGPSPVDVGVDAIGAALANLIAWGAQKNRNAS